MTRRNRAQTAANKRIAELPALPAMPRWLEKLDEGTFSQKLEEFETAHPILLTFIVTGITVVLLAAFIGGYALMHLHG